jgi:cytochrome P450
LDGSAILEALMSPEGRENPYPYYAAAHGLGPAAPLADGLWIVTGYDAVDQAFRAPTLVPWEDRFDRPFLTDWRDHPSLVSLTRSLLDSNPPDHTRMRHAMAGAFTARRVADLEPSIARIADELIETIAQKGAGGSPIDYMEEFAFRMSVAVISELFGVPVGDRPRLRRLGADWTEVFEVIPSPEGIAAADAAFLSFKEYFEDLVALRRKEPGDDLVSAVVQAAGQPDSRLDDEELICNLAVLLVAGYETTTNLFGNGLGQLFKHPEVADGLRSGEVSAENFVQEVLRYDSPVQVAGRIVLQDQEIAGSVIPAGTFAILLIGAANRDPARYPDPDAFDPAREDVKPASFGAGIHRCLGAALAELEGSVSFTRLLKRFPQIAPAGDPTRRERLVLRGYQSMPITVS